MGKFIVHGIMVEEPVRGQTNMGLDTTTIVVEEKVRNAFGRENINTYEILFAGKMVACIPEDMPLAGALVVVTGSIKSKQYKGRYYSDLVGEGLTIINAHSFATKDVVNQKLSSIAEMADNTDTHKQASTEEEKVIPNDDLPF